MRVFSWFYIILWRISVTGVLIYIHWEALTKKKPFTYVVKLNCRSTWNNFEISPRFIAVEMKKGAKSSKKKEAIDAPRTPTNTYWYWIFATFFASLFFYSNIWRISKKGFKFDVILLKSKARRTNQPDDKHERVMS